MNDETRGTIIVWGIGTLIVICFLGLMFIQPYFEAKSYRKITGRTDVTTWDALWLNLRVCDK